MDALKVFVVDEILDGRAAIEGGVLVIRLVQQILGHSLSCWLCLPFLSHGVSVTQERTLGRILGRCQYPTFLEALRRTRRDLDVVFLLQMPDATFPVLYEGALRGRLLDRLLAALVI